MSIIPLTAIELENRYREEQLSRVSYEEAKLYVDDRERQFRLTEEDNSINSDKFVNQVFLHISKNPIVLFDESCRTSNNVKDNIIEKDDIFKYFL